MAQSTDRQGTYLPTGWRVVGAGAEQLAARVAENARVEPGPVDNTLYALTCTMERAIRGRPTVERLLDAITEEIRITWPECPRLVRDEEVERTPSRFGGLRYDVFTPSAREWMGEMVWRSVHPVVAGAPITTRVLIEEQAHFARLSLRVTADDGPRSVRGYVGAGQAQPRFLHALRKEVTPTWMGGPLAAHTIGHGEVEDFVSSVLAAPSRTLPVVVLSPLEDGGFIVEPEDLAWDLLGRARLYVIRQHPLTFELSDAVGDRRMSCYWGAARCYLPGWSRHDDPLEHPLLVADRLSDPLMRATWLGEIGIWLGLQTELPPSIEERRPKPVEQDASTVDREPVDSVSGPRAPAGPVVDAAPIQHPAAVVEARPPAAHSPVADPTPLIETLVAEVRGLVGLVRGLADEVERLRTVSAVRSSSTNAIERRLGRLEDILEQAFPAGAADRRPETGIDVASEEHDTGDGRPDLVAIVHDAAETHDDALLILPSAYEAAAASPYEDPERVRAILDVMARVARRRRDGELGTSLREAFADLGIDYRPGIARSTPARLREQYRFVHGNGESVEAEEHIALGNTYDPRRCLRVYFSSRVPNEPRFVIGHIGRHFEVRSTT